MKKIIIFLCILLASFFAFGWETSFAAAVDIPWDNAIKSVSLDIGSSGNIVSDISNTGFRMLVIAKRFLMGLLVIFMVYTGAMMIMSMGSDDEQLSSSKRQIWYALVALLFINISLSLSEALVFNECCSLLV